MDKLFKRSHTPSSSTPAIGPLVTPYCIEKQETRKDRLSLSHLPTSGTNGGNFNVIPIDVDDIGNISIRNLM